MENPKNRFKAGLKAGRPQIGIWNALDGSVVAELLAGCGFDWIVLDTEHAPKEVTDVVPALQAIAAYPESSAVVRPAINDPVLIKRHLDQGAQTLLIPYVQSVQEARDAVNAMRYPPRGIRGAAGTTRASRFGQIEGYALRAEEELCLLLQVETVEAMEQLEEIATVEGVDGIFIGPADLAASMGLTGQPAHPQVIEAVESAIARLQAVGVPSGVLTLDPATAKRFVEIGTGFVAVGVDASILVKSGTALVQDLKP